MRIGGLAQLGEHLLCKQGVVGSIPSSSTNKPAGKRKEKKKKRKKEKKNQTNTKEALKKASLLLVRYRPDQSAVL